MINDSIPSESQQFLWASQLLTCLQHMGTHKTNAVLMTLNGANPIKAYQRYPENSFYFAGDQWRTFYHCHQSPDSIRGEHGHFHFFTQNENSNWAHAVGMSINSLGQPISLFTTNQWVTDGAWLDVKQLHSAFRNMASVDETDTLSQWFKYLLLIFSQEIENLIIERDNQIQRTCPENIQHCFTNRSIYFLSRHDINLQDQLAKLLH
jgi:hypothetical protein